MSQDPRSPHRTDGEGFPPEAPSGRRPRHSAVVPGGHLRAKRAEDLVHTTSRGELRVHLAAPSVIVLTYIGYADASFVDFAEAVFAATFGERTGIHLFIDCEEQTGYDTAFRERIVAWGKRIQPQTRVRCILVRSRIVAFGVAVVTALVGGRTLSVTTREAFASQLSASIRETADDDAA